MKLTDIYGKSENRTLHQAIELIDPISNIEITQLCNFLKAIDKSIIENQKVNSHIESTKGNLYFVVNKKVVGLVTEIDLISTDGYKYIKKLIENTFLKDSIIVDMELIDNKISFNTKINNKALESYEKSVKTDVDKLIKKD